MTGDQDIYASRRPHGESVYRDAPGLQSTRPTRSGRRARRRRMDRWLAALLTFVIGVLLLLMARGRLL